jgi:hypothetical protein
MRRFGSVAARCALAAVATGPELLWGASARL